MKTIKYMMFDFQLFADPNTQTTLLNSTGNDLSPEMKTFYDKRLIQLATARLVHQQFGEKVSIPKNGGKTIEFRQYSAFPKATTPLTEGVTPDGVPLNVTTITKTLDEFGAYTTLSDLLELTAIDNNIVEATSLHAESMGLTLDTITRNELVTGTQVLYAEYNGTKAVSRSQITANHKLRLQTVAEASTILKKNNTPKIDGSYFAIIHPSVAYDLMTDPGWIDVQKYSNATKIYDGEIGKLYGVRFVETTEAAITKGGASNCAVYSCLFFGKGAYKVIDVGGESAHILVKQKGSGGTADPLDQRSTVGWKIPMFGAKIVIPQYLLRVECGSSFSGIDEAN